MKKSILSKPWLRTYGIALVLMANVIACSNNESPDEPDEPAGWPKHRAFILNQGAFDANNACITFYAPEQDAKLIPDVFQQQNKVLLGQYGQCMKKYRNYIYVVVSGSNYISMMDQTCTEIRRLSFVNDADLAGGIRFIDVAEGYIYASFHGGTIAKINAETLTVENKLTHLGGNLEGVAACQGKLYVANSYSIVGGAYTYNDELLVIDLASFACTGKIKTHINPNQVMAIDGKVFVVAFGDYAIETYALQMVNPANMDVSTIGKASLMGAGKGKVYYVCSEYDDGTMAYNNTFSVFDIKTGITSPAPFAANMPDALRTSGIMLLTTDPTDDNIYIGTTDYFNNGEIYRFNNAGTLVTHFESGSISPCDAVFIY